MAIRYTSPHHSEDDPGGIIHEALKAGPELPGPAEDLLLAWTLRLAPPPQEAAARLLEKHDLAEGPLPERLEGTVAGRLVELLRQTAASPEHLPRRRGGRAGRNPGA